MASLWTDLRYGVRMLRRSPTLSLVSTFTLGLGVGLTAFTFSFVYALPASSRSTPCGWNDAGAPG